MASSTPAKPLTLTQAAFFMRKVILVGGITLGVFIVGRVFLESAVNFWKATHPEPPPPPTVGFGILPKLQFPAVNDAPQRYKLEVAAANMKAPSDRALVFFQPSKRASLLALDKAREQASVLGFLFDPDKVDGTQYRFRRTTPLPAVLDYNIINGTFLLRLDWQSDPTYLLENRLPTEDSAIGTTRQLLAQAGLLEKDIATSSAKVTYLKASGTSYTNTVSLSEADFLQVDIFRSPIASKYDVVTEKPSKGTVRAIISGHRDRAIQLTAMEYNYLPVNYQSVHTYPIISPQVAFQMLSQGKGYSAVTEGVTDAIIRSVRMGYYDSGKEQQYLQPIYILEGDGGYVGYVPAIDPRWISP